MILNELCTNAAKYGALSNANGCVVISAAIDASKERFGFTWGGDRWPVRSDAHAAEFWNATDRARFCWRT